MQADSWEYFTLVKEKLNDRKKVKLKVEIQMSLFDLIFTSHQQSFSYVGTGEFRWYPPKGGGYSDIFTHT